MSDPQRYPLCWPSGRPRARYPERSKFKVQSFARVRDELFRELQLLGAKNVILSSNMRLRQDGIPLANQSQPSDPGVAVYFQRKGRNLCFACDKWRHIEDNMQAINHTINALRGIARWGTGDMVDAAFTGFQALPSASRPWREVLGVSDSATATEIAEAARRRMLETHPDRGGDANKFNEVTHAVKEARSEGLVA